MTQSETEQLEAHAARNRDTPTLEDQLRASVSALGTVKRRVMRDLLHNCSADIRGYADELEDLRPRSIPRIDWLSEVPVVEDALSGDTEKLVAGVHALAQLEGMAMALGYTYVEDLILAAGWQPRAVEAWEVSP